MSKPVAPPWNDSSKNLVRDIAGHLRRYSPTVMVRAAQVNPLEIGRAEPIYPDSVSRDYAPRLQDQWPVLRRLLFGASLDVWHFFFAPNSRSSGAARLARTARRIPSVHTICSAPTAGAPLRSILFADVSVALSRSTYDRLAPACSRSALRLIPPCVPVLAMPTEQRRAELRTIHQLPKDAPVLVYPGDLERGVGAVVALEALAAWPRRDAILIMACRSKTPKAHQKANELRERARLWGVEARTRWLGETPRIRELLALSDFVLLPTETLYAKMDYPLVVLEAMSLGRPVLVGEGTPAAELAEEGGAYVVAPAGDAVARGLERLASDETARAVLQRRARDLAISRFSPQRVAAQYELLYDEVCG